MEKCGYINVLEYDYVRITNKEDIVRVVQLTINILIDYSRDLIKGNILKQKISVLGKPWGCCL